MSLVLGTLYFAYFDLVVDFGLWSLGLGSLIIALCS